MTKQKTALLEDKIQELTNRLKGQQVFLDNQKKHVEDLQKKLDDALDRKKLAGMYLQTLRLLPGYTGNKGAILYLNEYDYERIMALLDMDEYPEGF